MARKKIIEGRVKREPARRDRGGFDWGFEWGELRPMTRAGLAAPLLHSGLRVPNPGRYITDHLGASRALAALSWREARDEAFLTGAPRRSEHALYEAALRLARAESAVSAALQMRITPALEKDAEARRFVDEKLGQLADAQGDVAGARDVLIADQQAGGANLPAGKETPPADAPAGATRAGDETITKQTVLDLIEQVTQILAKLEDIEDFYEDDDKKDELAKAIAKIAGLILTGGKAALLGAIAELLDLLDLDAEPEDVDVDQTGDGGVYIYLKVKRTCFFIFDLDPDFIFYRKGGKAGSSFGKGQPAKDKYKKITEGAGGAPGTGTAPSGSGSGTTAPGTGTTPGTGSTAPGTGTPGPTPSPAPSEPGPPPPPPPQPPSGTEF